MTAVHPDPGAAPTPPGALGRPPQPRDVLDYLAAMHRWTAHLRAALDDVDARARLGEDDSVLTADITLAYALGQSIATRVDEVTRVWDSGRVGPVELQTIGQLLWSRLDEGSGGLAVSLTEACVLAEALLTRLAQRLERDPARSSVALRATAVREALARCRRHAGSLDDPDAVRRADRIGTDLDRALARNDPAAARAAVTAADATASALERELILTGAARASLAREREELGARLRAAVVRATEVRAVAARCASEVAGSPVLAVPDPARLGPVPGDGGDPAAARAALDAYEARLGRVEDALRHAEERYEGPLAELSELRGLLGSYRAKAKALGMTGTDLATTYDAARAALAARPCDLDRVRDLVGSYRRKVASGEDARKTPQPTTSHRKGGTR